MKGVINIDFIVSILIFLSTLSFVSMMVINSIPFFHQESVIDNIKTSMYQISHILLFDAGYPEGWDRNTVEMLGLSEKPYVLDRNKIDELNALCGTDYNRVQGLLTNYRTNVVIGIESIDGGTNILSCGDVKTIIRPEFIIKRFVIVDGDIYEMKITVV